MFNNKGPDAQEVLAARIAKEIADTQAALDALPPSDILRTEAVASLEKFLSGNVGQGPLPQIRKDAERAFEQLSKTVSSSNLHQGHLRALGLLKSALENREKLPPTAQVPMRKPTLRTGECFKEFRAANGDRILVGKGARDNEKLTMTIAQEWDVYMHARNILGAHVIIPRDRVTGDWTDLPAGAVDDNTLSDAAQLAVFFSQADPSVHAEAHYTWRRNVKKHPDSATGEVDPGKDLILLPVKLNLERLTELLSNQVFPIQQ